MSYTQHLKINVSVICKKADESEDFEVRREEKLARYKLTKLYLDFRMKKIKKEKWIAESMQTVDRIRGIKGTDVFYDIVQIQLLMAVSYTHLDVYKRQTVIILPEEKHMRRSRL